MLHQIYMTSHGFNTMQFHMTLCTSSELLVWWPYMVISSWSLTFVLPPSGLLGRVGVAGPPNESLRCIDGAPTLTAPIPSKSPTDLTDSGCLDLGWLPVQRSDHLITVFHRKLGPIEEKFGRIFQLLETKSDHAPFSIHLAISSWATW